MESMTKRCEDGDVRKGRQWAGETGLEASGEHHNESGV